MKAAKIMHNWAGGPHHQRHPNDSAYSQYDWFCPNKAYPLGLNETGFSRIKQSIEAFVYCILVAQTSMRSPIVGSLGSSKQTQAKFLDLFEDEVRKPDMAESMQCYQMAVDEAKLRLNLAVCLGTNLMLGNMVINTDCSRLQQPSHRYNI